VTTISTHVLDVTNGLPAVGLAVVLERHEPSGAWHELGRGVTGSDGRVRELAPRDGMPRGTYRLVFASAEYFAARALVTFYPHIAVIFEVDEATPHLHVPLILGPFGYSTYRGS
jgi:5-hydroxyisourate hydrolase